MEKGKLFAADFETTGSPTACRVWLWGVRDIATDEVVGRGTNIKSFIDSIKPGTYYFHNSAFDLSFVMDYLLRKLHYEYVELDYTKRGRAAGLDRLASGQFTCLIGDQGQHYEFSWADDSGAYIVRDSLRKAPGSLAELGVAYGYKDKKGETPIHWELPDNYQPTQVEWDYLDVDTGILAHVMRFLLSEGLTAMTIGADCFADWKLRFATPRKGDNRGDGKPESVENVFRRFFPEITQLEDGTIRKAYRGGWTYVNEDMRAVVLTCGGTVFDANSMYPAVMVKELFPYGEGLELKPGQPAPVTHPLSITGAFITYRLKDGKLPCIPSGAEGFGGTGWSKEGYEVELWATNKEWDMWNEHYEIDVDKYLGGYAYQAIPGSEVFGDYIGYWMGIKETAAKDSPQRQLAKLMLANLWGKFGTNPYRAKRVPSLVGDGAVTLTPQHTVYGKPVYTPVAIFTTSYARQSVIRAAQRNISRFCYADTDSIHLKGTAAPEGIEIHASKLGAWKHEGDWTEAIYCRPKAYIERMTEESSIFHIDPQTGAQNIMVAMAGLPREARDGLSPETVYDGQVFSGDLSKKRVVGGIVLAPISWKLDYRLGIVEYN